MLPASIAGSSRDASGNSPAMRVEAPPPEPPRMDISAVLKAAEIQPWERKVLEQYAQLQAIRKQAALAMEYAKVHTELQVWVTWATHIGSPLGSASAPCAC